MRELSQFLGQGVTRRQALGAAGTVVAALACSVEQPNPGEAPFVYTPGERQEAIKWIKDLTFLLDYSVQPEFSSQLIDELNAVIPKSDGEVHEFLSKRTHRTDNWVVWSLSVKAGNEELPLSIRMAYGRVNILGQWQIVTNLKNKRVPKFAPYFYEDSPGLIFNADSLKALAGTFFRFSENMTWVWATTGGSFPSRENTAMLDLQFIPAPTETNKTTGMFLSGVFEDMLRYRDHFRMTSDDGEAIFTVSGSLFDPFKDTQGQNSR